MALLEELRAPALAIEAERDPARAHQAADLGQDLPTQHREEIVVGRGRDDEQRLGILLLHPEVGRRRHAEAAARHIGLRQRVGRAMVRPHMAIDVEEPDRVRVVADPALGQSLTERRGLPPGRQLRQLAPQGLDLGRAVEPEQDPQFPGWVPLQLLRRADAQQGHERQAEQRGLQPVEPVLQGAVDLVPRVQQAEREHRRQGQQDAARAHRLGGDEPRGRFRQLAQPGQGALGVPLDRDASRGARRLLAPESAGPRRARAGSARAGARRAATHGESCLRSPRPAPPRAGSTGRPRAAPPPAGASRR